MRLALLMAVTAAGSLILADPAPAFEVVARDARTALVSDGRDHASFVDSAGVTRLLGGRGREVARVPTPISIDPPRTGGALAIGGGMLLWWTSGIDLIPKVFVLDLGSRSVSAIDTEPWAAVHSGATLFDGIVVHEIGRNWISGTSVAYHAEGATYLNWRTGRVDFALGPSNTARNVPDLDEADLWRPLCSPLRRRQASPGSSFEPSSWKSFQYQRPYGVTEAAGGAQLLLQRCGQPNRTILGACRKPCRSVQLGARIVTWTDGRRVHAYFARARCRRSRGLPQGGFPSVQHVRRRLFISIPDTPARLNFTIYAAPLSRCRPVR